MNVEIINGSESKKDNMTGETHDCPTSREHTFKSSDTTKDSGLSTDNKHSNPVDTGVATYPTSDDSTIQDGTYQLSQKVVETEDINIVLTVNATRVEDDAKFALAHVNFSPGTDTSGLDLQVEKERLEMRLKSLTLEEDIEKLRGQTEEKERSIAILRGRGKPTKPKEEGTDTSGLDLQVEKERLEMRLKSLTLEEDIEKLRGQTEEKERSIAILRGRGKPTKPKEEGTATSCLDQYTALQVEYERLEIRLKSLTLEKDIEKRRGEIEEMEKSIASLRSRGKPTKPKEEGTANSGLDQNTAPQVEKERLEMRLMSLTVEEDIEKLRGKTEEKERSIAILRGRGKPTKPKEEGMFSVEQLRSQKE